LEIWLYFSVRHETTLVELDITGGFVGVVAGLEIDEDTSGCYLFFILSGNVFGFKLLLYYCLSKYFSSRFFRNEDSAK